METLKLASECNSKEEIRGQIDLIDAEIIRLFGLRFKYVEGIVKFKTDAESVVAIDRKNEVIHQRGEWAAAQGLDKNTFEFIYKYLIEHNISKELEILGNK